MSELRVGIVGGGTIGRVHAACLRQTDGARLVAVAEPREATGREFAATHEVAWHRQFPDLLQRSDVDVVVLCSPSGLHAEQAIAASEAGKHVITEKPMATTLADADQMIAACRAAGVTLSVIFQKRFGRDVRRLKRGVEAGRLGRIALANAVVPWYRSAAYFQQSEGWRGTWALDGGGALMNQAIHAVDLVQWLLGPVQSISGATAALAQNIEAEDTASAIFECASGAIVALQATTLADRDRPMRIEVIGRAGWAVLEDGRLVASDPDLPDELLSRKDLEQTAGWSAAEPFGAEHGRQLSAIFRALREGREPPIAGDDGRIAVALVRGIYESAAAGTRLWLGSGRAPTT